VVSENSLLHSFASSIESWNGEAKKGNGIYDRFDRPTPGYQYKCFLRHMPMDRDRMYAGLVNERLRLGAYAAYSPEELP
jgi:hypothetical protein